MFVGTFQVPAERPYGRRTGPRAAGPRARQAHMGAAGQGVVAWQGELPPPARPPGEAESRRAAALFPRDPVRSVVRRRADCGLRTAAGVGCEAVGGERVCVWRNALCQCKPQRGCRRDRVGSACELAVLTPAHAPPTVQKGMKPDLILVHYFDGWADVHSTPSRYVCPRVVTQRCARSLRAVASRVRVHNSGPRGRADGTTGRR